MDNRDLPRLLSSGYQISFLEEKKPGHEVDRSGLSNAHVRLYLHLPIHLHGAVFN
jgi:hypothetical protein